MTVDLEDLEVFEETPVRSLNVPVRAIKRGGARPVEAVVVVISACIVLAALVSRPGGSGVADPVPAPTSPRLAAAPAGRPASSPLGTPSPTARPVQVLDLASPGPGTIRVTSNRLTVAGQMLVRATRVEITLAASGNRLFGHASADVSDPDGGIRPARSPTFEVEFDLAEPRPIGTMLVVVTAYDASGSPIGGVRRAISIEPLANG